MNVTRRNNGLAITGSADEIIALLASHESRLLNYANVTRYPTNAIGKAALAEHQAQCRQANRLRLIAEKLQQETDAEKVLQVETVAL